ncbi:MAG TPA: carbamoyl-phosphate synthase (glutamine-hydrolyzing) small subunit [Bacteroidales bacterium]|jgi:carbamoyl-phosphate synthase small subunit|nr:carbamoyl-phosphate synthase (glutamine-hydrolyzing) small subunit [Bacteroidales bacterium]
MDKPIKLVLEDGTEFNGYSFGSEKSASGEVVFNTSMVGYTESLTDPSYKGQILTLTYPLIGNYGVPGNEKENNLEQFYESYAMHISGLIVSDYTNEFSHWNAKSSLGDWLKKNDVPGIYGIDTRELTKILREKGTMLGKIIFDGQDVEIYDPATENQVAKVSISEKKTFGNGKYKVTLIDCGVKYNIVRNLIKRDATVTLVPWNYDFTAEAYDGLFISNGPGDPKYCEETVNNLKKAYNLDKPITGICLGNQLMALAAGADTYKLKYGHRSHNQPCIQVGTDKAFVTSQNHGYATNNDTLTNEWEPLFINLNDGTNEGVKHKTKPYFSSQFHPEASSGPTDTEFLFDMFMENVKSYSS